MGTHVPTTHTERFRDPKEQRLSAAFCYGFFSSSDKEGALLGCAEAGPTSDARALIAAMRVGRFGGLLWCLD